MKNLENRHVLLTGATRGIGKAVAKRFAQEGATLILVGRTARALEKLDDELAPYGIQTILVPLDLRRMDAIDEMAYSLMQRFGKLDALVGNAGVLGSLGPITHQDPKVWQEVMDINLSANWRLMRAFDPLLRASPSGRALFVTSSAARPPHAYLNAYAISKAALEHLVHLYALESATTTNLKINLVDPGVVATNLRATAFPGEDPKFLPTPESITDAFVYLASAQCGENGQLFKAQEFTKEMAA